MTPLLDAIYRHILTNELTRYLDQEAYRQDGYYRTYHEKALMSSLSGDQKKTMELYMEAVMGIADMEAQAIFYAALSAGLSLSALYRP